MFGKNSGHQFKNIRQEKLAKQEDVLRKTKNLMDSFAKYVQKSN